MIALAVAALCAAPAIRLAAQSRPVVAAARAKEAALEQAILAAENARPEHDAALAPLREGLKADGRLQRLAVRALGRLERAGLVSEIAPLLESPIAAVRAEAANALGQAVQRAQAAAAIGLLATRAQAETDPQVLGAIARTLGRLPYQQESEIRVAERTILAIADRPVSASRDAASMSVSRDAISLSASRDAASPSASRDAASLSTSRDASPLALRDAAPAQRSLPAPPESSAGAPEGDETTVLFGVSHGLDALARRAVKLGSLSAETRARLRTLAGHGLSRDANAASNGQQLGDVSSAAQPVASSDSGARSGDAARGQVAGTTGTGGDASFAGRASGARQPSRAADRRTEQASDGSRQPGATELAARRQVVGTTATGNDASFAGRASGARQPSRAADRHSEQASDDHGRPDATELAARVRRLAVAALVTVRESNVPLLRDVLRDPDDQVRRLGVIWLGATEDMPLRDAAFRQAFGDTSAMVRYEVLRTSARVRQTAANAPSAPAAAQPGSSPGSSVQSAAGEEPTECALEVKALDDPSAHVALLAIDLLGRCAERRAAADRLTTIVSAFFDAPRTSRGTQQEWHRPAHALVGLARLMPDRASGWLARAAAHEIWQVRMYGARAAGLLADRQTLDALALDADDNVRHAAIEALQALVGHEADPQYLAALDRPDPQLLRTAARALAGTSQKKEAADRLLKTFVRVSAARRETSRDVRLALLETLATLGATPAAQEPPSRASARDGDATPTDTGDEHAAGGSRQAAPLEGAIEILRPYLADFDPLVAERVAALLTTWTGQSQVAAPARLRSAPVPSPREIDRLARTRAIVRLARGSAFTLALRPDVAPTNAARFVRLARAGYFNGLTFHRVEPNFVLQGGSPGANEYAGDGPFTRDELALTSNVRGTMGLSTRGRDTGDAQFYVNLVDNYRLDHNYTVFADIVDGRPIVENLLEGDVIARIELRERP